MKDPAFLFYPNDYMGGTLGMTLEEKGAYMELLILQFNKGHFTIEQAKKLLNGSFERLWEVLKEKFTEDETRGFFNERLEEEKNKRKNFNTKQKEKGSKGGRPKKNPNETQSKPVGYENNNPNLTLLEDENENRIETKDFEKSEKLLPAMIKTFKNEIPDYFVDEKKDMEPLLKISGYIAKIYKLPENILAQTTEDKNEICRRWGDLAKFISTEDFFKNYSISQIEKHFQSIHSKQTNGNKYSGSAKAGKGKYEITGTGGY
jgi:uncharacterized protein YdaU (DUF1376 family)